MKRSLLRSLMVLGITSLVVVGISRATWAGEPSEGERKSMSRALFIEGVRLQEQGNVPGNFQEALKKFEAAQKLYPAPTSLLHIAECQAAVGRLVEAAETYRALGKMTLPADAPPAFVSAQQQGAAELPVVEARIPQLRIDIKEPSADKLKNLQIALNDRGMPVELIGTPRPIDPGKYKVVGAADGYVLKEPTEIVIAEREKKSVSLVFTPGTPTIVVPPVGAPAASPAASAAPSSSAAPSPPALQPKPQQKRSGIFVDGYAGLAIPRGIYGELAGAGGEVGIGAGLHFGHVVFLGLRGGLSGAGAKDATSRVGGVSTSTAAAGGTSSLFGGALFSFCTSGTKLGFYGEAISNLRFISYPGSERTGVGGTQVIPSAAYFAIEAGIGAGVSIPVAPNFSLIPKVGVTGGIAGSPTVAANDGISSTANNNALGAQLVADNTLPGGGTYAIYLLSVGGVFAADLF
jgi:hypothetical protein